jgi:hypothetical protein
MPDTSPQPSSARAGQATAAGTQASCIFCLEPVNPGALVCRHCGNVIGPIQQLVGAQAALEARLSVLEATLAAPGGADAPASLRLPSPKAVPTEEIVAVGKLPGRLRFRWPHMVDNLFLGLSAILVVHWLASTLPSGHQSIYRLAGLIVAFPFGFRFEFYSQSRAAVQVLAALAFGVLATACIGTLDYLLGTNTAGAATLDAHHALASLMAIGLSHLTGSATARWWRRRSDRAAVTTNGGSAAVLLTVPLHGDPQAVKARFDALRAIMDAGPPVTAAAVTAWAAITRLLQ